MFALHSLISRTMARLKLYPHRVHIPLPDGSALRFVAHSPVEHFRTALYGGEREVWYAMLAELHPDDVLFDIGASVGLVTVGAAKCCRTVYAFEPDPETQSRLVSHVTLNKLANVHIVPWAVSDQAGSLTLYSDGAAGYAPSLARQERPEAPKGEVKVATDTLDAAIARGDLPLPTVLKIDIEGAEILCLRGAQRLLAGELGPPPRLLMIEVHPQFLPAFGADVPAVEALVNAEHYSLDKRQPTHDQDYRWYRARGRATT